MGAGSVQIEATLDRRVGAEEPGKGAVEGPQLGGDVMNE